MGRRLAYNVVSPMVVGSVCGNVSIWHIYDVA
jgi:hypothetical protein